MTVLHKALSIGLYGAAAVATLTPVSFAVAQTTGSVAPSGLESVTVIGSRRANASATDTPVPIDFIPMTKTSEQGGQFDLSQSLQYMSPSFNSTRQTGADGADLI
ncbi:MAG: TonB-dependent receptor, partial [Rhodoferax sp.]